ncbi:MAG TPA: 30S ribosome-binding factor RbfA [Anaerolineae bacterium]|nr:30S ribosome-binding factor RbfA [Anaerolineae bacterium]HOR00936.1 30S ribosome-binding factor RbfA [Anaerolineae bacterium]HPL29091.1 30S ribosome-binding factor RbfA [Anaerolineae bacterium]
MASRRQRKVADLIQEEISDLIARKMRDPRVEGVTVTEVHVSPDLRYADIYVSKLDEEQAVKEAVTGLNAAAGYLKRELAPRLDLRFMPDLRFHLDRSWQQGARIDALLEQIAEEREGLPEEPEEG